MTNGLKYLLLTIQLLLALQVTAQYSIDKVCTGSIRRYRIDGEPQSTYTWEIKDQSGSAVTLPSNADTVQVSWNMSPGIYYLTAIQHSSNACDATLELGTIEVFAQPLAFAGNDTILCSGSALSLSSAYALNSASVMWTSSGDGTFDNILNINPIYTPGSADLANGYVQLNLTANGLGNGNSCLPATSSRILHFMNPQIVSVVTTDATCGLNNGSISISASGNTNLMYSIDNGTNWSSDSIFNNLSIGSYWVTIKDGNCELPYVQNPLVINSIAGPGIVSALSTDASCGLSNGTINIVGNGTGMLLYSIDNGTNWSVSPYFDSLAAGNYLIRIKDSNCETVYANNPVIINNLGGPQIAGVTFTDASCGHSNGTITINASGSDLLFSIDDGINWSNSGDFDSLSAGNYLVRVKNTNCESIYPNNPVIINNSESPVIASVTSADASCGQNNGTITISATGTGPMMFSVNNGADWYTDSIFNSLPAGSYMIKVRISACESLYPNNPVIINSIGGSQILSVLSTDVSCGQTNGSIAISATNTGSLLYSIDDGANWSTDSTFNSLPAGSYLIRVKDSNCETLYPGNPVIINSLGGPQIISLTSTDASCGLSNGTISIVASGTGTVLYSIDNGISWSGSGNFAALPAGTYTIKIKDDLCEAFNPNNPVIINSVGGPVIASVTSTNASCGQTNGSITITASGTGTIFYSINNGISWSSSSFFNALAAGIYNIRVKDDNCETIYSSNPLIINDLGGVVVSSVSHTDATCGQSNGTITITASGTGTLLYSIDNGINWSVTGTFSSLPAGNYTIKVKDDYCEATYPNNPVIINSLGGPQITTVNASDATCGQSNGTITITASGSGNLLYSINDGLTWSGSNTFNSLDAGTYLIRVKDNLCESIYPNNPVIINSVGGPQITDVTFTNASCGNANGSITITATGTGNILYSIDNGANWSTSGSFGSVMPGSYTIRVKDANCEQTYPNNPVIINDNPGVHIASVVPSAATCGLSNGSITISASGTGNLLYSIDNGINWSIDSVFLNLAPGNYSVSVKNDYCETKSQQNPIVIAAIPVPVISGNQHGDVSCHEGNNGWAEFTVAQGTAPYTYSWNDTLLQTTAKAVNLPAGVYTVVVLDANGCQLIDSIQISEPDSSIAVQVTTVPVSCFGASNGSVDVTVSGGVSPYTLSWSNGMLGNHLVGLSAGSLTLSITDAIGCTFDSLIVISQPQMLVAEAEIINPIMTMGGSATVMITATGGTEPYKGVGEYFVSPGYQTFYVSDTNGCTANVSINVPDAGKILTGDTSACLGDHLSIPIFVFGFKDIASFKMNLGYNTSLLHCTGFRNVDPSIYSGVEIYHDSIQGEISILWHDATPVTIADSGQVIELIFKTLAQGKSGLVFNDSAGMNVFYNVYNQEIPVQFNSGNAKIIVPAVVEIIGNKTLDFGDPLELMAMVWTGNPMTYQWLTPSDNTSGGFIYKVEHVGEADQGDYIIKVLDRNGCLANDTVLVSVGSRQLARIEVPTGFSPNADGLNDDFLAYTNLDIPFEYKMLVYNKWGELIFESDNINNGWDGTYKGQPCQSDLYTWVVYFKVPGYIQILQESPIRGVVMLLR